MSHSDPLDGRIRDAVAQVLSQAPDAPEFDDIEASPVPHRRRISRPIVWAAATVAAAVVVAGAALAGTGDATIDTGIASRSGTAATGDGEPPAASVPQSEPTGRDTAEPTGVTKVLDSTGKVRGVVRDRDVRAEAPALTIAGFRAARVYDDGVVVGYLLFNNVGFVDLATAAQPDLVQALDHCFEEYALTLRADRRCRKLLIGQGVDLDSGGGSE